MTSSLSVVHILRVNHAGEYGAICIYRGQISVARFFSAGCVGALTEMLAHERTHFQTFGGILVERGVRPCHALPLWAFGGWVIGIATALLGTRSIWVCTTAIERTVSAHLAHQVEFLRASDYDVLAAVQTIQLDEESHEQYASRNGGEATGPYVLLSWVIAGATSFAIWLSTKL
ncbi:MAG: demethoxyubiquinone hydroxylase family protein [Tahibacter sp.]